MIRIYLRASTADQHANRAHELLKQFALNEMSVNENDLLFYTENASGTKLDRVQLMQLLNDSQPNDILLVESVDRLSRLSMDDWEQLKSIVKTKGIRLVVRDLDTTHKQFESGIAGEIMQVINSMLIDLMATMARLDNQKRLERSLQGIRQAKLRRANELSQQTGETVDPESITFGGRNKDQKVRTKVIELLNKKLTVIQISQLANCGEATVYRIKRELKQQ